MKPSRLLPYSSVAASAIFLLANSYTAADWPIVFKVSSILILAVLGFHVDKLLGTALAICALGDFLLGVRQIGSLNNDSLFLLGLGSFLVAHLVYVAMFRKYGAPAWRKLGTKRAVGVATILIALGFVLAVLRDSLGSLLIPVVVYAAVLAGMAISAMLADLGNPLAAIGGLFFVASDATLAIGKFHGEFPGYGALVWMTYYLAQLLILLGIARQRSGSLCPHLNTASKIEQRR